MVTALAPARSLPPGRRSRCVAGAAALLVSYGSSGRAFTDVVFGHTSPQGRLPFDLPSSTRAVEESRSDMPFDTVDPLFRFGDGIGFCG